MRQLWGFLTTLIFLLLAQQELRSLPAHADPTDWTAPITHMVTMMCVDLMTAAVISLLLVAVPTLIYRFWRNT